MSERLRLPVQTVLGAPGTTVRAFWNQRSIRAQLLIIVLAIELVAAVLAGVVTILKARNSTRVEIDASVGLAKLFVTEAVQLVHDDKSPSDVLQSLPLQLRFLRHVRISVRDAAGVRVSQIARAPDVPARAERSPAPAWFATLIAPPIESHAVPVMVDNRPIGSILIVSAPGDEIAEVWENTLALAVVALLVTAAMMGALYVLFGRALAPLTGLVRGLADLEKQKYAVRLATPATREFFALYARFNALAQALDAARAENIRLGHRLISAQDDERRHTALELHDEVGPSLFGLKAMATSIADSIGETAGTIRQAIPDRARDMLAIIEHLQVINRSLLNRLRPMALGHVALQELVAQVIRDRAREHPQIAFASSIENIARSYGDTVDLTLFRCVQESLTNAIRHAQARNILVRINEIRATAAGGASLRVELEVEDDGRGIAADAPPGFGLTGMQERVRALGGDLAFAPRAGGGTIIRIVVPIQDQLPGDASGDPKESL
jgi:two-component system sensor histidine kinase UhpB